MTAIATDYSVLTSRTNDYLHRFHQHTFKSEELRAAVPIKSGGQLHDDTRFAHGDVTSMTGLTAQSESGLVMDPDDKERAVEDLAAFKDFISTLKFAYLESNMKLQFVSHVMAENGPKPIALEDNAALEKERLRTKAELKQRKIRAAELENLIRTQAEALDKDLSQTQQDASLSDKLLKECEAMEVEIAMLKNKRSPLERITIEEAQALCEEQEQKIATYGPAIKHCEQKMKETKIKIRAHKSATEKLAVMKRDMTREQEEREAKGKRDERAEEGCRWVRDATTLYSSLMGIRTAYASGSPPKELVIEYENPNGSNHGVFRTLSIALGSNGMMTGAHLLNSSDDIEDIVQAYLINQDIRSMIQDIRARIGR